MRYPKKRNQSTQEGDNKPKEGEEAKPNENADKLKEKRRPMRRFNRRSKKDSTDANDVSFKSIFLLFDQKILFAVLKLIFLILG